jgi:hypothetical protein
MFGIVRYHGYRPQWSPSLVLGGLWIIGQP